MLSVHWLNLEPENPRVINGIRTRCRSLSEQLERSRRITVVIQAVDRVA